MPRELVVMSLYKYIGKPLLFLVAPETAHHISGWFFRQASLWENLRWRFKVNDDKLRVSLGKIEIPNPIGLAAGFDKNCEMVRGLFSLGFSYLTLGSVTLDRKEGNPKPRVWRYPGKCLVNSMGLPNVGARKAAFNISNSKNNIGSIIVSISGLTVREFTECYGLIEPYADGVELNISTPNTAGVRVFQDPSMLRELLDSMDKVRGSGKPVWVKVPPYFDEKGRENVLELVDLACKKGVDGITATNTKPIREPRASIGVGGLSGPALFTDTLRIVSEIYRETRGKTVINACGGVSSGRDAWNVLKRGATSIQLYTALVFEGPGVVSEIKRRLLRFLEEAGLGSIRDVIGTGVS